MDVAELTSIVGQLRLEMRADRAEVLAEIKTGYGEITDRLDGLNGRTRKAESAIAVLEDRASFTRDNHARYAGWIGSLAALGSWIYQFWPHKP